MTEAPTEQNSDTSVLPIDPHEFTELLEPESSNSLNSKLSQTEIISENQEVEEKVPEKDDELQFGLDRGMQLSICGGLSGEIDPELFTKYIVSWEDFILNPKAVLENPNLVIKDGERKRSLQLFLLYYFLDRNFKTDKLLYLKI